MSFKTKSTGARTLMIVFLALVMVFALSAGISAAGITFEVEDTDGIGGPDEGYSSTVYLNDTDYIPAVAWEKEGYLFLGWQAEDATTTLHLTVQPITGYLYSGTTVVTVSYLNTLLTNWDYHLTAAYQPKSYSLEKPGVNTFTFKDETLKSITGDRGDIAYNAAQTISYTGSVPSGKKLIGWTVKEEDDTYVVLEKSFNYNVTGEAVITPILVDEETVANDVLVTFKDVDGTVLNVFYGTEGTALTMPAAPTKEGYTFSGWDRNGTTVAADADDQTYDGQTYTAKWTAQQFAITPSAANATASGLPGTAAVGTEVTVTAAANTGHELTGVYATYIKDGKTYGIPCASAGNGAYTFTMPAAAVTVNVDAAPIQYDVQVKNADGTLLDQQSVAYNGTYTLPDAPKTEPGYYFNGWLRGNVLCNAGSSQTITGDTVFTAEVSPVIYAVFENDGTYTIGYGLDTGYHYGDAITLTAPTAPQGQKFLGWKVEIENENPTFLTGTATTYMIRGLGTLTPVFADNDDVVVTFKDADGTVMDVLSGPQGSALTMPADPQKEGYTFNGWSYNGATVAAGANDQTYDGQTYVAQWTANNYRITFDPNAQVDPSTMDETEADADSIVSLNLKAIEGYEITGVSVTANNSPVAVSYLGSVNGTSQYFFTMPAADVTVTVTTAAKEYTLTYRDDVSGEIIEQTSALYQSNVPCVSAPDKEGRLFVGWEANGIAYKDVFGQLRPELGAPLKVTGDLELTAVYEPLRFDITRNADGSYTVEGNDGDADALVYGTEVLLTADPAEDGTTFIGWLEQRMDGGTTYYATDDADAFLYGVTCDATLTAVYKDNADRVAKFMDENGPVYDLLHGKEGTAIGTPVEPQKDGYTFLGWFDAAGTEYDAAAKYGDADVTYYAKWEAVEYTVTVDANDQLETVAVDSPATVGTALTLKAKAAAGYEITGVSMTYEANNAFYTVPYSALGEDENGLSSYLFTMPAGNVTIKVFTAPLVYDVTAVAYGDIQDHQFVAYSDLYTLPEAPAAEDGQRFVGWDDNQGTIYQPGQDVGITDDTQFTAVYEQIKYALTYDADNTTYTVAEDVDGDLVYGEAVQLTVPTRENYEFVGWEETEAPYGVYMNGIDAGAVNYVIHGENTLVPKYVKSVDSYKLVVFESSRDGRVLHYFYRHIDEDSIVAPAEPAAVPGYEFTGWENINDSNDVLQPGDGVSFSEGIAENENGVKVYVDKQVPVDQELICDEDHLTNIDYAFDSANTGVYYPTDSTVFFDCTGEATPDNDKDDVIAKDGYRITSIHVSYELNGQTVEEDLEIINGSASMVMPATSVTYYAVAEKVDYLIYDRTENVNLNVTVNGNPADFTGDTITAEKGSAVNVIVTVDEGYSLLADSISFRIANDTKELVYNIQAQGNQTVYSFVMPEDDVYIHAEAVYDAHIITEQTTLSKLTALTDADNGNANIIVGSTPVPAGHEVHFTLEVDEGYALDELYIVNMDTYERVPYNIDNIAGSYYFTMPSAPVQIVATAEKDLSTLIVVDYDNTVLGIHSVETGSGAEVNGNAITIEGKTYTAQDREGYVFDKWIVTATGDEFNNTSAIRDYMIVKPAYTALDQNLTLAADSSDVATVTVTYENNAAVTLTAAGTVVPTGKTVYVTATPDPNYEIDGIAVRGADNKVKAIPVYLIEKNADGSVTYSFEMPAFAAEVCVYTKAKLYDVGVVAHFDGAIDAQGQDNVVINEITATRLKIAQGETAVITATPKEGYHIEGVKISYRPDANTIAYVVDDVTGAEYDKAFAYDQYGPFTATITVPCNDVTVDVTYVKNDYAVNYSYDGAKGTHSGPDVVTFGETASFTATPEDGYKVESVSASFIDPQGHKHAIEFTDDSPVMNGDNATYTFTVPAAIDGGTIDVKIVYTEKTYQANVEIVNKKGNDEIRLDGVDTVKASYDYKSTVNVTAAPKDGWIIDSVTVETVNGVAVPVTGDNGAYQFTMPADDVIITVAYTQDTFGIEYTVDGEDTLATAGGAVTNNDTAVAYQSTASFTVTPNAGYMIDTVTGTYTDADGIEQTVTFRKMPVNLVEGGEYTFVMPVVEKGGSVRISVNFKKVVYDILVERTGEGEVFFDSGIVEFGKDNTFRTSAEFDSVVNIIPQPAEGWRLDSVEVVQNSDNTPVACTENDGVYSFNVPADSVTVKVVFVQETNAIEYIFDDTEGAVTGPATGDYQDDVTFNVVPGKGYVIDTVTGAYTDPQGVEKSITFTAVPSDMRAGGDYTFTMPAIKDGTKVVITTVFKEDTYNVTTDITGECEVRLNDADKLSTTADYKETVKVTVTPDAGWILSDLTVTDAEDNAVTIDPSDIASDGGSYTFVMPAADVTVKVVCTQIENNIEYVFDAAQGTAAGDVLVNYQSTAKFTVTPESGYVIDSVTGTYLDPNGVTKTVTFDTVPSDLRTGGEYTFIMPAIQKDTKVTVTALFKEADYTVNAAKTGEGEVRLNNNDTYTIGADYNDTITVTATPAEGWNIKSVTAVDEAGNTLPLTPDGSGNYTFTMPDSDVDVEVVFAKNVYTVTVITTNNGKTTVDKTTVDYNDTVTVTADPADGYRVKKDSLSVLTESGKAVAGTYLNEKADYVTEYTFVMPAENVTVSVEYTEQASSDYTDVRTDHWFYHAVTFVTDRGYFYGIDEDIFAPYMNMNRAMFVTVLARIEGADLSGYTTSTFTDVDINEWYGPSVEWAVEKGIAAGYGDGTFGPADEVTREQMCAFMYRYAEYRGCDMTTKNLNWMDRYIDADQASAYANDAIAWCVGSGIILGTSENTIEPLGLATRAQVAQVIMNFVDKVIYK